MSHSVKDEGLTDALVAKLEAESVTCEFGKSNHLTSVAAGAVRFLIFQQGH